MHLLVTLAALLGVETDVLVARLRKSIVASSVIALFALIGLCFLLIAANTALTTAVGPIWAPLIIAGVAIVIALIVYLATKVMADNRKAQQTERRRSSETSAFITTAALTALPIVLKSSMARNVGIPLAVLVGLALLARGSSSQADED